MKKQIIITLSFLIVSLSVLGMASYAWFSNNRVVEASGLGVSVVMPINIMASLDAPEYVTSLEGFSTHFTFGSLVTGGETTQISEYDMLIPITSSDGLNFLYLPFRYVGPNGTPKEGTDIAHYVAVNAAQNTGYYIDIPLYLTTTTKHDLNAYVKYLSITDPTGEQLITGAVRCAVLVKEDDAYRTVLVAKDEDAVALKSFTSPGEITYYPLISDGVNFSYADEDIAVYESEYYSSLSDSPYIASANNKISLKASGIIDGVGRYYTTEVRLRVWVEGTDRSAVYNNAGAYFAVSVILAADEG